MEEEVHFDMEHCRQAGATIWLRQVPPHLKSVMTSCKKTNLSKNHRRMMIYHESLRRPFSPLPLPFPHQLLQQHRTMGPHLPAEAPCSGKTPNPDSTDKKRLHRAKVPPLGFRAHPHKPQYFSLEAQVRHLGRDRADHREGIRPPAAAPPPPFATKGLAPAPFACTSRSKSIRDFSFRVGVGVVEYLGRARAGRAKPPLDRSCRCSTVLRTSTVWLR